jgi:hypothetical protein
MPVSAGRLWSASTDSKLDSFRQNSLMPGVSVTSRPIEIGFVWSESLEVWNESHVSANRKWVRLVRILNVDDWLQQGVTQSRFTGIDDLILRYLLCSTFPSNVSMQIALQSRLRSARLLQQGNREFAAQLAAAALWHLTPVFVRGTHGQDTHAACSTCSAWFVCSLTLGSLGQDR